MDSSQLEIILNGDQSDAKDLDAYLVGEIGSEHHESLQKMLARGLVDTADTLLNAIVLDNFDVLRNTEKKHTVFGTGTALADCVLNTHKTIPDSLWKNIAWLNDYVNNDDILFGESDIASYSIEKLALQVMQRISQSSDRFFKTDAEQVSLTEVSDRLVVGFNIFSSTIKLSSKPPYAGSHRNVIATFAKLVNDIDQKSEDASRDLTQYGKVFDALFKLNLSKAQWIPFLAAIPAFRGTPFTQEALSGKINYNAYCGVTPVDILLLAADLSAGQPEKSLSTESHASILQDMLDNGLSVDGLFDAAKAMPEIQEGPYAWRRKHSFITHEWVNDRALSDAFFGAGLMGFMTEKVDAYDGVFTKLFIDQIISKYHPERLFKEKLIAIGQNAQLRQTEQVATLVNSVVNYIASNKAGELSIERATNTFIEAGWIQHQAITTKQELLTTLLSGPAFAWDRDAAVITKHNVMTQVVFGLNPELIRIAINAGHDPHRLIQLDGNKTRYPCDGTANTIAEFIEENWPPNAKKDALELMSKIFDQIMFTHNNSLSVNGIEAIDTLLDCLPKDYNIPQLVSLMSNPVAVDLLLKRDLIDFTQPGAKRMLSEVFRSYWSVGIDRGDWYLAIDRGEHQEELQSIFRLAIEAGITLSDELPLPEKVGNETLGHLIESQFGDAGLASFNHAQISVTQCDATKSKPRNRL